MIQLTRRNKIIIVSVGLLVSFAAGRYTVTESIKTEIHDTEVKKIAEDEKKNRDKEDHKKVVIVVIRKPDGEETTTTTETDDSEDKETTVVKDTTTDDKVKNETKVVTKGQDKVTVSALGGINVLTGQPQYGAAITKPILGPLNVGLWGLNTGAVGASVGVSF